MKREVPKSSFLDIGAKGCDPFGIMGCYLDYEVDVMFVASLDVVEGRRLMRLCWEP